LVLKTNEMISDSIEPCVCQLSMLDSIGSAIFSDFQGRSFLDRRSKETKTQATRLQTVLNV